MLRSLWKEATSTKKMHEVMEASYQSIQKIWKEAREEGREIIAPRFPMIILKTERLDRN